MHNARNKFDSISLIQVQIVMTMLIIVQCMYLFLPF